MVNRRIAASVAAVLIVSAAAAAASTEQQSRHAPAASTGAPRYMSLRTEGANGRHGPGVDQKIDWIYEQAGLPFLVTGESGPWRRVRDPDGAQVWMHASNLEERRTVFVQATGETLLKSRAAEHSRTLARLTHGVVGKLTGCADGWRRIAVGDRAGWVKADALWAADDCTGV